MTQTLRPLKSNPAKRTLDNFGKSSGWLTNKTMEYHRPLKIYCGIGCLRNQSTRKSPRERIFCGVGFPGEKTRDSG